VKAARRLGIVTLGTAMVVLSGPGPVHSQDPDPNVSVTDRPRPAYDPLGLRAGGYLIFPSLTVSEIYDDNVFADSEDEDEDFITRFQPNINFNSNFPRHRLDFSVGADVGVFADTGSENDFQDAFGDIDGRLDITRDSELALNLNAGRFHEGRDDPEDPDRDEISTFLRFGGALTFLQNFNRINLRPRVLVTRSDFQDIDGFSQDDRDETRYDASLRVGYFISPRINLFTQGGFGFDDRDDDEPIDRDRYGWSASIGTAVDITAVLFGDVFVGYRQEFFDNDDFDDEDGIAFGANLTWNPTTLTTLNLSGDADFESTTNAEEGASSNFESNIALRVDHELLRNVLIGAFGAFNRDDFRDGDRTDNTFDLGASVTYLLNRNFSVGADYVYTDRNSDDDDAEFSRNRVGIRITAQL